MYRCVAVSVEGFVQQLAVAYVQHGHWFYVMGEIPPHKEPRAVDAKLVERYGLNISKWSRARAKALGRASVQYLRHGHFFVLIATYGDHPLVERESNLLDIRKHPIRFSGYSISYRRGVDRRWHASVRIAPDEYLRLKAYFVNLSTHRSVENLIQEFRCIKFEPYAPIRRQLFNILREVNRQRKLRGFELVPLGAIRLKRRIVKPFGDGLIRTEGLGSIVASRLKPPGGMSLEGGTMAPTSLTALSQIDRRSTTSNVTLCHNSIEMKFDELRTLRSIPEPVA